MLQKGGKDGAVKRNLEAKVVSQDKLIINKNLFIYPFIHLF